MAMMNHCKDFLGWIDDDMSLKIFKCLDDPADLARVCCVSRSWRDFVITNSLYKQLCLRMFPELARVLCVVELNQNGGEEHAEAGSSHAMERRDHRVYSHFARSCVYPVAIDCIAKAIGASSTDNFPQECIEHTLEERDNIAGRFSYWSSSGQHNPNVPETLTYQLASQLCVIKEINIQPFQAHFQMGSPIYSAQSVRVKMGYFKESIDSPADEMFVWTYTSPVFPMAQENRIQKFTLPEPVLCVGGIMQIELLGRVQKQEMDGLLYICIAYVQAKGIPLAPAFTAEILETSGMFVLKRDLLVGGQPQVTSENEPGPGPGPILIDDVQRGLRDFRQVVTILRGHVMGVGAVDGWEEEEYELYEDFDEDIALA